MKWNNYETMRDRMRPYFLTFDQQEMIRKFDLKHDEAYLYLRFCGSEYRIHRTSGVVERSEDGFCTCAQGDFNESMSIYDVLCCSKPNCRLSGEYAPSNSLKGIVFTGTQAGSTEGESKIAAFFDAHVDDLERACIAMGGVAEGKGDLSYRLALFDFLPVRLSFWRADEEFPAEVRMLWDTNVLQYMHFETLFYAGGHLLKRLQSMISEM